jgi:TonB-dependent siderophore receptor
MRIVKSGGDKALAALVVMCVVGAQGVAMAQSSEPGTVELPTVAVTGTHSRDEAATENSDSYSSDKAGVGSKSTASSREIPQTISVVTRKRMDEQNLTSIEEAMKSTTGMVIQQVDPARFDLFARGYRVDTIQVDGVTANLNNFFVTPDLAVYDRLEVLRGPNSMFSGSGNPSGSVNLARKRALDVWQLQGSASGGSRDYKRGEFDITGPLVESKRVRARVVGAYEDKGLIYSPSYYRKPTVYGTLEVDLTEQTTASFGVTYTAVNYLPFAGLPAYANGTQVNVPRSTLIGAEWNRWTTSTVDTFGELEHRFDNGGKLKFTARQIDRSSDTIYMTPNTAVNAAGFTTLNRIRLGLDHSNTSYDANYSTPFQLFGQTQNVTIGYDRREFTYKLRSGNGPTAQQNVFNPNYAIPYQDINFATFSNTTESQSGAYGQLRFKPVAWLTLIGGGRISDWQTRNVNPNTSVVSGVALINAKTTANYGAVIDLSKQLSLYVSYADIFQPQSSISVSGAVLPPRVGSQREVGVKAALLDGKLNAHLALFEINDVNRTLSDPANPTFSIPAGEVESKGFEAEVSGKLTQNWDITAGYAFTSTRYLEDTTTNEGLPFAPTTPNHSYTLWTRYNFDEGALSGFSLGSGAKIVSTFYTRSGAFRYVQEGYETYNAQIGYQFNKNLWATLTVTNLFDRTYYQWVNTASNGNRYGEPRTAILKVSTKW